MSGLYISLFGRFRARCGEEGLIDLEASKAQELFCYLLLHRDQPQAREALASRLWGDHGTTSQSRKYLRNSLWQLQSALNHQPDLADSGLLLVEPDWIQLRTVPALWLDVAAFEAAYASVRGVSGRDVDHERARELERAVHLYTGDLLANWQMDWCLYERARLVHIHLVILDKLMGYCEANGAYEDGLFYGERILQFDRAREYTHRQMMQLYHLAGDRTGALRQFKRCTDALKDELAVAPAQDTLLLFDNIRQNRPINVPMTPTAESVSIPAIHDVVVSLQRLQASLANTQQHVQQVIKAVEGACGRER